MSGEQGLHGFTIKPIAEAGEVYGRIALMGCSVGLNCPEKRERTGFTEQGRTFVGGGDVVFYVEHSRTARRSGRTTPRSGTLCQTCGEKYAALHGLPLPDAVAV